RRPAPPVGEDGSSSDVYAARAASVSRSIVERRQGKRLADARSVADGADEAAAVAHRQVALDRAGLEERAADPQRPVRQIEDEIGAVDVGDGAVDGAAPLRALR